mmetsp:Transcript_37318/g.42642  ORF Transcript_37318/g.42642 Transcript_37318/m.42642 type:complete len:237 (+) Transcript_37318:56-766(+)
MALIVLLQLILISVVVAMAPPLPPKPLGTYLTGKPSSTTSPTINVDCYLDLVCPFSDKMFLTLYNDVLPIISADETKKSAIAIKIYHVVQPWHPQGTMVHEAALAVKKVANEDDNLYLNYFKWICEQFTGPDKKFSDADTWNQSRSQIYESLLLYFQTQNLPNISASAMKLLVPPALEGNCGNDVTQDIKWTCKHHRAMGVHVTPTVFVNGIEAVQISSGWKCDDWVSFFDSFELK